MREDRRVALYLRVSTGGQTCENQELELKAAAERHGWQIVGVFRDASVSGVKERRPALDQLMAGIARKEFDLLATWSVDRLGRSLQHLLGVLGELKAKGVDLYLHQQGLDTSTPAGRALFQMLGVFAEFERAIIVERVHAGLRRARAQGKRLGRPSVAVEVERRIRRALANGASIRQAAKAAGCGLGTVQRVKAALTAG